MTGSLSVDGRPRRREEILAAAAGLFADSGYRTTSMREVAAAAGILAGSLYHHFPSKEAIAIELVERYHADLVRAVRDSGTVGRDPVAALRSFARDVAEVSYRHRAALKITMYDAPATAGSGLKTVVHAQPATLDRHWRTLISAAAGAGTIDPDLDTRVLRHVLRATTLQVGVMTWERGAPAGGPRAVADCVTSILFDGLAAPPPGEPGQVLPEIDESVATRVVGAARARWAREAADGRRQRRGMILDTARTLFARRGFEATTVRDIADRAGLQAGNLYRYFPSKDAMAAEILSGFSDRLLGAYQEVLDAKADAAETLEALCWLLDQAGRSFSREIEILKGPTRMLSLGLGDHYRQGAEARYAMLVGLIEKGVASGELSDVAEPALVASCVREIMWSPMRHLAQISTARVRDFCRRAVLAGAAARRVR